MLLTAFVDESMSGGQEHCMVGALVSRAQRWHRFYRRWDALLLNASIEFSHLVAMENGEMPFEGWSQQRTAEFVRKAVPVIEENCDFGFTAIATKSDHRQHFLARLDRRTHQDSLYGICARSLIEGIAETIKQGLCSDAKINFVFEQSHHFAGVERIFHEMKDFIPSISNNLGTISAGEKTQLSGLQGADLLASIARRAVPTAQFRSAADHDDLTRSAFKTFHYALNQHALDVYARQADQIALERRGRRRVRRSRKKAERCAVDHPSSD